MTKYTVVWPREIQDRLADIWIGSRDRAGVTAAAAEIDRLLSTDPLSLSVEFHEGIRILIVPPLRILFAIREEDRVVEVGRVSSLFD